MNNNQRYVRLPPEMTCISFNYRRLGRPQAITWVKDLIRSRSPELVFLMETHRSSEEMKVIKKKFIGYEMCSVASVGRSGGLALFWNSQFDVSIVNWSRHHIAAEVTFPGSDPIHFIGFYGWADWQMKYLSWKLLRASRHQVQIPWVVVGDYNQIMWNSEKVGGRIRRDSQMKLFREAVSDYNLRDAGFFGTIGTFTNDQLDDYNLVSTLDRVLLCEEAVWRFPLLTVEHLQREL